jgi:hypothetical protein
MKRDMNLVREILLWATAQEDAGIYRNPTLDGYSESQIAHHVHLMWQAGLVEAANATTNSSGGPAAIIMSVTWAGHDFIDAARDDTIWNKTKNKVLSSGAAFTFDLLKEVLVLAAKGPLGLP